MSKSHNDYKLDALEISEVEFLNEGLIAFVSEHEVLEFYFFAGGEDSKERQENQNVDLVHYV